MSIRNMSAMNASSTVFVHVACAHAGKQGYNPKPRPPRDCQFSGRRLSSRTTTLPLSSQRRLLTPPPPRLPAFKLCAAASSTSPRRHCSIRRVYSRPDVFPGGQPPSPVARPTPRLVPWLSLRRLCRLRFGLRATFERRRHPRSIVWPDRALARRCCGCRGVTRKASPSRPCHAWIRRLPTPALCCLPIHRSVSGQQAPAAAPLTGWAWCPRPLMGAPRRHIMAATSGDEYPTS